MNVLPFLALDIVVSFWTYGLKSLFPIIYNAYICLPSLNSFLGRFRQCWEKLYMSWPVVSESSVYPCAGGEVERQVSANEILCVAPNVSRDRRTRGWPPEHCDPGGGTVCHCGKRGPSKWNLHEEHSPLPKTHSLWVWHLPQWLWVAWESQLWCSS